MSMKVKGMLARCETAAAAEIVFHLHASKTPQNMRGRIWKALRP